MITVIAEHSVDLSLLSEKANILDLGCRGFLFTNELRRLGHNVEAVDIDDLFNPTGDNKWTHYDQMAITGFDGVVGIERNNDPQATKIGHGSEKVQCMTLATFSKFKNILFWDLIKIDIEGSEYEVIMSLTEPPAKQLSIEFHLHTGIYGDAQVKEMEDKLLSLGYFPAKHDKYPAHGLSPNYWDSLFILQS
jgi:hypothetical protein